MALTTTGITTTIVKNAIGLASNNVGALCSSSNINKWSKYKPVRYNSVNINRSTESWWCAQDGNCGLNIPVYANIADMFTALRNNTVMWDYLKPSGGATQPFRIADFGGYEHSAQPPFVPQQLNSTYYATLGTMPTALDLRGNTQYELNISDFGEAYNLGNMYFGVAICKQNTSGYKYMTVNTKMNTGGGSNINVPISNENGNYEVVYFLAENPKLSFLNADISNAFVPVPSAMQIVTIQRSPITVYVTGTFGSYAANYEITIQNNQSNTLTLNGCNIAFRYANKQPTDAFVMGEGNKSLGTVTIQGNSSLTLSGTIFSVGEDYDTLGGYLWFSNSTNSSYNTRGEFEV